MRLGRPAAAAEEPDARVEEPGDGPANDSGLAGGAPGGPAFGLTSNGVLVTRVQSIGQSEQRLRRLAVAPQGGGPEVQQLEDRVRPGQGQA